MVLPFSFTRTRLTTGRAEHSLVLASETQHLSVLRTSQVPLSVLMDLWAIRVVLVQPASTTVYGFIFRSALQLLCCTVHSPQWHRIPPPFLRLLLDSLSSRCFEHGPPHPPSSAVEAVSDRPPFSNAALPAAAAPVAAATVPNLAA